MIALTRENYHSNAANRDYMSRGQYKSFLECEAKQMATLNGAWVDDPSIALEVGQYVHTFNDGTIREFIADHPGMFKKDGSLKSEYIVADRMIDCLKRDPFAMYCLEGQKEVIVTAELFGAPWKVMLDVQNNDRRRIVDLKTTRSVTEHVWDEVVRKKVSFVEAYQYPLQMALYCEVERIAMGRDEDDWSEFLIVAVSKEKSPDKAIINMTDPERLIIELETVAKNMPRIIAVKAGLEEPKRCECCDYCRSTKILSEIVHYTKL